MATGSGPLGAEELAVRMLADAGLDSCEVQDRRGQDSFNNYYVARP